jgi:hypothetical protein
VLVSELVAAQAGVRGQGDDGQLAVGVQRGSDQQAHHGVGDGSDLRAVLGVGVALGAGEGLADELGQRCAVARAARGHDGVFIGAP